MVFKPEGNLMELIWIGLPKTPDPDHVVFSEDDLKDIWLHGFVDTERFPMDDWLCAFEPNKTPDGTYLLKKEEFLEKDKFRFTGEIFFPFEPILINEGKYTDEGLQELVDKSIAPNCAKSKKEVQDFFENFRERYREKDKLIRMDLDGKREIAELINQFPSPTRRRELIFDAMFAQQVMATAAAAEAPPVSATPEQAAQVQMSTFTMVPTQSEAASKKLRRIEKTKKTAATGGDEGVALKKVRRSRKGMSV